MILKSGFKSGEMWPRRQVFMGKIAPVKEMDGLRGLAIALVLLHHTVPHYLPKNGLVSEVFGNHFSAIGVPLFFIVSGFCIAFGLFQRGGTGAGVADFARRRFWRIYPPYVACMTLLFIKVLLVSIYTNGRVPGPGECLKMLGYDLSFTRPLFPAVEVINPAFWSLCVEFQFYLMVAVFLYAYGRGWKRSASAGILLAGLMSVVLICSGHAAYGSGPMLPAFVPLFLLGVASAWLVLTEGVKPFDAWFLWWVSLLSVVVLVPDGAFLGAIFAAALPLRAFTRLAPVRTFYSLPVLQYLGKTSYSIYLMHGLGIFYLSRWGASLVDRQIVSAIGVLILSWAFAIGLGLLFYRLVEVRFIRSVDQEKPS